MRLPNPNPNPNPRPNPRRTQVVIIEEADLTKKEVKKRLLLVEEWVKDLTLPKESRVRILNHFRNQHHHPYSPKEMLLNLPFDLRQFICKCVPWVTMSNPIHLQVRTMGDHVQPNSPKGFQQSREKMGSPTLQTLQEPVLLTPCSLCFRGGGFPIPDLDVCGVAAINTASCWTRFPSSATATACSARRSPPASRSAW
jgi:hypothetical protein